MKEQLITFETAKLAKEKGFNINCKSKWRVLKTKIEYTTNYERKSSSKMPNIVLRPTQSSLKNWLWLTHKIWVEITLWGDSIGFNCMVKYIKGVDTNGNASVYGEATTNGQDLFKLLEVGLQEGLNLIKKPTKVAIIGAGTSVIIGNLTHSTKRTLTPLEEESDSLDKVFIIEKIDHSYDFTEEELKGKRVKHRKNTPYHK